LGTTGRVEFTTADAVLQVNGRNVALGELIGTGVVENGSVSSAGTLVFSSAGDANFGGVLRDGAGARALNFTKSGDGTLTLSGTASYTGWTTVAGGTLGYGAEGALPAGGNYAVSGGNLDLSTRTLSAGTVNLTAGAIRNGTLTAASYNTQSGTVTAVLAGPGGLTQSGTGTTTLNAANQYSGGTTVNSGKLLLGGSGSLASAGSLTVNGGAFDLGMNAQAVSAVVLNSGVIENGTLSAGVLSVKSGTVSAALSGAGSLTKTTSGTVVLSGSNTYLGSTNVGEGRLVLSGANGALPAAGDLNVTGGTLDLGGRGQGAGVATLQSGAIENGTLTATAYAVLSGNVSAVLAGTGGLSKSGTGTVTLQAANTYTGGTTVSQGSLVLGSNGALADSGSLNLSGGAVDLGGRTQVVSLFTQEGGALQNGTLQSAGGFAMSGGTVGASLAGPGALLKTGTGQLQLNAANAYTGGTTIQSGTVVLGTNGALAASGAITLSGGELDLGGKTQAAGSTVLNAGAIRNGTLVSAGTYDLQSGSVGASLAGTAKLAKSGTGTVVLLSRNTYSGGTELTAGTLVVSHQDALSSGTVSYTGGLLSFSGVSAANLGALQGSRNLALTDTATGGAVALSVGSNGASTTYTGILSGSGSLTKVGAGSFTLTQAASYTGATTVSAGTLQAVDLLTGSATVVNQSILNVKLSGSGTFAGNLSGSGETLLTADAPVTLTLTSTAFLNGRLTIGTGITLDLSGTGKNIFGDDMRLTLQGTASLRIGSTTQEIATLLVDVAGGASVNGTGGKILYSNLPTDLINANNEVLAGASSSVTGVTFEVLTKYTTVAPGTLNISAGRSSKALSLAGTAGFNATSLVLQPELATTKVRIDQDATVTQGVTARRTLGQTGGLVFVDAALTTPFFRIEEGIVATLSQTGSIVGGSIHNSGTLAVSVTSGEKTIANQISGTGMLDKTDAGTAILSGVNDYSGVTRLTAGVLAATNSRSFGTGAIRFAGGTLRYANSLAEDFSSRFESVDTGVTAHVDTNGNNVTFASVLAGSGVFQKSGSGVLALTGTNTLTGGYLVRGGTLQVGVGGTRGSLASGVDLAAGTSLRFARADDLTYAGSVSGNGVLVQAGLGTLTLNGASTFDGGLVLNSGTVLLASAGAAATSGSISFGGGVLKYSAANTQDYSARFASSPSQAYRIDTNGQNVTFSTAFGSGAATFSKLGAGKLTFAADEGYTGATTVHTGTLELLGNQSGRSAISVLDGQVQYTLGGGATAGGTVSLVSQSTMARFLVGSGSGTFTGTIAGAGSIVKEGLGTLSLTQSQTNTGGVTLLSNGGLLALSGSAQLGGAISIQTGSVLDAVYGRFNSTTTALSLSGGTLKIGAGTMTVQSFSISGGSVQLVSSDPEAAAMIFAGTIQGSVPVDSPVSLVQYSSNPDGSPAAFTGELKGTVTALPSISDLTLSGTSGKLVTLAVAPAGSAGYGLQLSTLTLESGVNVKVTEAVRVSGPVWVKGGSFELTSGLNAADSSVTFGSGTAGAANVRITGTNASVAARSVAITGQSTLTVGATASRSLEGVTTLTVGGRSTESTLNERRNDATLIVDGTLNLAANQTLKGSGQIVGNVTLQDASSVLSPGNSPGTLFIAGSLNLQSGVLKIEAGRDSFNNLIQDQVAVTGGSVILGNGTVKPSLLIVDYDGKLSSGGSAGVALKPFFVDAGTLTQAVTPVDVSGVALAGTSGYGSVEFARQGASGVTANSAMYAFDPTALLSGSLVVKRLAFANVAGLSSNVLGFAKALDVRVIQQASQAEGLLELGTGVTGAAAAANVAAQLVAANPAPYAELSGIGFQRLTDLQLGMLGRIQQIRSGAVALSENGLAAWNAVYGSSQSRSADGSLGASGYSSTHYGDLMGLEKHWGHLVLGLGAAVGRTTATFGSAPGKLTADSWHTGLYACVPLGAYFFDTGFLVGQGENKVRRSVVAPGLTAREGRLALNSTEWMWQLGASRVFHAPKGFTLTPSARFIAEGYSQGAALESDMAGLEVKTSRQNVTAFLHQLGLELNRRFKLAERPAAFALSLDWIHQYDAKGRALEMALSGDSSAVFTATGAQMGADAVRMGAAMDVALSERTTLRLSAEHQIQSQLSTTRGLVSFGISF
ncbi:MAG: hypothetical protein RLZZ244_577, partial [Verrucomicrobiota bacterium]